MHVPVLGDPGRVCRLQLLVRVAVDEAHTRAAPVSLQIVHRARLRVRLIRAADRVEALRLIHQGCGLHLAAVLIPLALRLLHDLAEGGGLLRAERRSSLTARSVIARAFAQALVLLDQGSRHRSSSVGCGHHRTNVPYQQATAALPDTAGRLRLRAGTPGSDLLPPEITTSDPTTHLGGLLRASAGRPGSAPSQPAPGRERLHQWLQLQLQVDCRDLGIQHQAGLPGLPGAASAWP